MASRSIEEATTPNVAKNIAWRSRGITWVEIGSTREPHLRRDMRLDTRVDLRERADRAGDRAGRDLLARRDQAFPGARKLRVSLRELQPERHRLGMDAVRAADGRRHLVLEGAALERLQQLIDVARSGCRRRARAAR